MDTIILTDFNKPSFNKINIKNIDQSVFKN